MTETSMIFERNKGFNRSELDRNITTIQRWVDHCCFPCNLKYFLSHNLIFFGCFLCLCVVIKLQLLKKGLHFDIIYYNTG